MQQQKHKVPKFGLKNINYNRTITLEVFTGKQDAKDSANKLKELWMNG